MNQPISRMCFFPSESSNFFEFEAPPKEILKVQVRGACVLQFFSIGGLGIRKIKFLSVMMNIIRLHTMMILMMMMNFVD